MLASVGLAAWLTARHLLPVLTLSSLHASGATRASVLAAWAAALVIVHGTLGTMASWDVQGSGVYTFFYDAMGLAWIGVAMFAMEWLGLSVRDDVLERRNPAALAAVAGAVIGFGAAFAGGNVGDGPGWWCVVFAGGLASLTLSGVWVALHVTTGVADAITIDRDVPTGVRTGALLAASGVIVGRAAAGDWISASETVGSFVRAGWPVLVLAALAAAIQVVLRPRPRAMRGALAASAVAGLVFVAAAWLVVSWQGIPA